MHLARIGLITALLVSIRISSAPPALAAGGPCVEALTTLARPRFGQFTGNITAGPDAGRSLSGAITLRLSDTGDGTGTLAIPNGPTLPVTGRVAGHTIRLDITTSDGAVLEGHGTLPANCLEPNIGGKLTGPHHPDKGDWGVIWGNGQ